MRSSPKQSISYGDYCKKHHNTVEYLGYYLDSNLKGKSMSRRDLKKINTKLNVLWRQSNYLDYKTKLQIAQMNYIPFCFELPPRSHINPSHFREKKTEVRLNTE